MAGVTARKRGKYWQYRFDGATVDGKRKQFSHSGYLTKKEAIQAGMEAYRRYRRGGTPEKDTDTSIADFVDHWLERKTLSVGVHTCEQYASVIRRYIKPRLGKYTVGSMTRRIAMDFVSSLSIEGIRGGTIKMIIVCLAQSFDDLLDAGIVEANPFRGLKLPKTVGKRPEAVLSAEQYKKVIDNISEDYRLAIEVGWHTGMRVGEVVGLTWDRVDFSTETIRIDRQIQIVHGKSVLVPPKAGSTRTIRMGAELKRILLKERERQLAREMEYGGFWSVGLADEEGTVARAQKRNVSGGSLRFVCVRADGSFLLVTSLLDALLRLSEKLGFRMHFHALRHAHATHLLEAGAPIKAVQERLGHSSVKMTLDVYTHATEAMGDALVSALDHNENFLWPKCGQNRDKQRINTK